MSQIFRLKDIREVEKMFALAIFNVLAHNRDDHSKNFSFFVGQIQTIINQWPRYANDAGVSKESGEYIKQ